MRLYQGLQAASRRDARLQSAGLQSSYSAPTRFTHWRLELETNLREFYNHGEGPY